MKQIIAFLFLCPFIALGQTLTVSSTITLTSGNYSTVEVKNGANITINGTVTFGNLNPNNSHDVYLTITKGSKLTISSSLNQNGKFTVTNHGELITGNHEMQGGENNFYNYGTHKVNGDQQITSGGSTYTNCGLLEVSANENFHNGRFISCDCGVLITNGLNVNGSNKVEGSGFIKVTGNLNLNGFLTQSNKILFCYSGTINQSDKIGSAIRTCTNTCTPPSLSVKFSSFKAVRLSPSEFELKFDIEDYDKAKSFRIMKSTNAQNFEQVGSEIIVDRKVKSYTKKISLKP